MLVADAIRMNAYRAAIRRNIKAGDVVVDLGTGTGILAMLAAQQSPKVVHAIDLSNIITLAERLTRANHFTNIVFHLEPACVKDDYRIPYLWETKFPGIDFSSVKESPGNDKYKVSGHDWQVGTRSAIDYFLCDSSPILAFDLNEINQPTEVPRTVSASRVVRRSGRMDGFCLYFRVMFDAEVEFDTSPFSPRTVWDSLHVRVESREYHQGETIAYSLPALPSA